MRVKITSTSPSGWVYINERGAMEIILAFLVLEYILINEKGFVALVITAIVTSMMSGPHIHWEMQKTEALRYGMTPIDR